LHYFHIFTHFPRGCSAGVDWCAAAPGGGEGARWLGRFLPDFTGLPHILFYCRTLQIYLDKKTLDY